MQRETRVVVIKSTGLHGKGSPGDRLKLISAENRSRIDTTR